MKRKKVTELFSNAAGIIITVLISFSFVIVIVFLISDTPVKTIYFFFIGPFTNTYYFGNMINQAIPLIFTGLGIAVAFKSSVFNLGGEGQIYAGAITATVICLWLPKAGGVIGSIIALAAAVAAGTILAGLSGLLRMKWGTDELITSFLISSAVLLIINYYITGPLQDPENNLLTTRKIEEQFHLLRIYLPSKLDISIFIALIFALGTYFFMQRTHWGYEMRMCGINREFARYGGINVPKYLFLPMAISGGFHGLGGGLSILGTHYRAFKGVTAGMGWNGIAVALIAKNNPIAVVPAALFFAYLDAGAKAAMLHSDVTFEIAKVAQAVIFYFVTAQSLYSLVKRKRRRMPV